MAMAWSARGLFGFLAKNSTKTVRTVGANLSSRHIPVVARTESGLASWTNNRLGLWTGVAPLVGNMAVRQMSTIKYKQKKVVEPLFDDQGRELIKLRRGGFALKMREIDVTRNTIHTSVKKLKLLTTLVRNKPVPEALLQLRYCRKMKSADMMQQINEGVKRAEEAYGLGPSQLKVVSARIGNASIAKRVDIKGRGRTGVIRRRFCHLYVKLREIDESSEDPWVPKGLRAKGFRGVQRKYKRENRGKIAPVPVKDLPSPSISPSSSAPEV